MNGKLYQEQAGKGIWDLYMEITYRYVQKYYLEQEISHDFNAILWEVNFWMKLYSIQSLFMIFYGYNSYRTPLILEMKSKETVIKVEIVGKWRRIFDRGVKATVNLLTINKNIHETMT